MSLKEKLDKLKADFEARAPAEVLSTMHRATQSLAGSGILERALGTGAVFPGFSLPDQDGNPVSSDALLDRGPLVVSFYRGVW